MKHSRRSKKTLCYEEKHLALQHYFENDLKAEELAKILGVHRATVFSWLNRIDYNFANIEKLKQAVKKKERLVRKELSEEVKSKIHALLKKNPKIGPLKIKQYFFRHNQILLSEKIIYRYLKESGIIELRKKAIQESAEHTKRFEYECPLGAVQIDTLYFKLINDETIYLLTFLDDHSRFILTSRFVSEKTMDNVITLLTGVLKTYGFIEKLLTDKGSEFVSWNHFTRFEEYLCTLDIELISSGPKMPFIQGKIERWHQTMRIEFEENCGGFTTLFEAQKHLDKYVNYYNYQRPHQGIGGLVPADRFFGIAKDLEHELSKYKLGFNTDKRIYFCCNIAGQRMVVSGMRPEALEVYSTNTETTDTLQNHNWKDG